MAWELVLAHVLLPSAVAAAAGFGAWRCWRLLRYGRDPRLLKLMDRRGFVVPRRRAVCHYPPNNGFYWNISFLLALPLPGGSIVRLRRRASPEIPQCPQSYRWQFSASKTPLSTEVHNRSPVQIRSSPLRFSNLVLGERVWPSTPMALANPEFKPCR